MSSPTRTAAPLLRMSGIRKTFGDVVALDGVDLEVGAREIHGLLGGNGAGKTTLMNVLYGLYAPDSGTVEIDGVVRQVGSPRDAIAIGVGMVHQSFLQVDTYTVTENVVLGTHAGRARLDLGPAREKVRELSERFGLAVDPDAVVEDLPVGVRQRVEILKALYRGARILVLDEPTTNLTPQEVDALFSSMRAIVDEGMSVILITHKIRETMAVCDRMTVMRDGRRIATTDKADTSAEQLAATMVGESLTEVDDESPASADTLSVVVGAVDTDEVAEVTEEAGTEGGPIRVRIENLCAAGDQGVQVVRDVDLTIRRGEVVGIAGVAGNGQVELAEAIAGVRPLTSGSVRVDETDLTGHPTAEWLEAGVAYVPEDRQRDGILPTATITENLLLGTHRRRARTGLIDWRGARREATSVIQEYAIKAPGQATQAGQLSGGNIQRVILARAFAHQPKLLLLHNPTRGLDIRSTQFVYEKVREAAAAGCSVLVLSEDLDELVTLADRICVIYSGALVGERSRNQVDPYEIGRLMTGIGGAA
ncbi:MAG TPA: ABC transporter ATP-binding protein [Actinomycetales bacterium]|nr:ABC transporter ATP-binding protein [Actinomycetales bacterium]